MQKRNFVPKCLVITLIVSFLLLFQAPIKNHDIQSTAWAEQLSDTDSSTIAEELLILFNLPAIVANTSEKSIELLIEQSPDAEAYADVIREFAKRYLTWENLKASMIKRYTESFNKQELQQLKTFFSSAVGKKYIQKSETLMLETTQDITETILSSREDLQRMIIEKELEKLDLTRKGK